MDTDEIKVVHEFPRDVQEIENTFIPLADGIQLAARIWMPEDALENPVPAILEFLPYRKRDGTIARDEVSHRTRCADPSLLRWAWLCLCTCRYERIRRI